MHCAIIYELLAITKAREITLISSTLNVIPFLKGNTLIITYDGVLLNRYMKVKDVGKSRWNKEFENRRIDIFGFEDIDQEYKDAINKSCEQSEQDHNKFLHKIASKVNEYVKKCDYRLDDIVIECTTIMQIVPMLKKMLPAVYVIGLKEAIEIIVDSNE